MTHLFNQIQQYWKSGSLTDKVKFAKYKVTEGFPVEYVSYYLPSAAN